MNNQMKKSQYFSILISLFFLLSFSGYQSEGQIENPSIKLLSNLLQTGSKDFAKNKVFLKTDKDIYCPGEKIWFKAEIMNCLSEAPSNENELIVMLKSESGEIIADSRYLPVEGKCDNELGIPSWASEGNAYLIAYSQKAVNTNDATLAAVKPITINSLRKNDFLIDVNMSKNVYNPGEEARLIINMIPLTPGLKHEKILVSLFDINHKLSSERFSVESNSSNEIKYKLPDKFNDGLYFEVSIPGKNNFTQKVPVHTSADNIMVEFYPEGGTLLTNNIQRIMYRASDPFGKAVDVSGNVFDERGNQAGAGKMIKTGYGMINLMPMLNQKYYFKIDDEYGKNLEFELPEAILDGSAFSLIKTEDSTLRVAVYTVGKYTKDTLTLAAIANGKIILTSNIDGSKKNNIKIATNSLPQGIVNFVIFAPDGKILSERLLYNTPNREINIDIKTQFKPSEKNGDADITIDLSKFISHFGKSKIDVHVVDKFNLYELNQPNSYSFLKYPLQTPVPKTVLDLYLTNLELIANELKYYSLNDLIHGKNYLKQETGKNISGIVIDKNQKGVANATVMAIQSNNLFQETTTTDSKGRFTFNKVSKSKDVIVKAFSSFGKKTYSVHLDETFDESLDEIILLKSFNSKQQYNSHELIEYCQKNKELLKFIGTERHDLKPGKTSGTEKLLQSGSTILDVIKMTKPFRLENNQIVFYGSSNSVYCQQGALIIIDGQKMGTDANILSTVNTLDVKSINISTDPVEIQRYTGLNSVGIIEITTKFNTSDYSPEQKSPGFHELEFFDPENIPHSIWRYQTTLLWKNDIPVDDTGEVIIKIKASEIQSEFVVFVDAESEEGIRYHEFTTFSTIRSKTSE
jgi:hypothetical protein